MAEYIVSSGVTSSGVILNDNRTYAKMYVLSGGFASNTTIHSGHMYVYSGGSAQLGTVNTTGMLFLSGGYAQDFTAYGAIGRVGGDVEVRSGGFASNITVADFGDIYIFKGGYAEKLIASSGGHINLGNDNWNRWSHLRNLEWGSAQDLHIYSGGELHVGKEGNATSSFLYNGGIGYVSSGGTVTDTTVNDGGCLYVSNGAIISGRLQIAAGATVSAYSGTIIDFTVAQQADPNTALINDWSLISGGNNANYTITVNADQALGSYMLAENASNFSRTITVKDTSGMDIGIVSVNTPLEIPGKTYTLSCSDGALKLDISEEIPKIGAVKLYSSGLLVSAADIMTGKTLQTGGNDSMTVTSGGTANDTIVQNLGSMVVISGGKANGGSIYRGWLNIDSGGFAQNFITFGGDSTRGHGDVCISGGFASNITASCFGDIYIFKGGYAEKLIASSGGHINLGNDNWNRWSHLRNLEWGSAQDLHIYSGGELHVGKEGNATSSFLYNGGIGYVSSGGTVTDTTVNDGGCLYVSNGAIISGRLQIAAGATVSAYSGTIIDFTVAQQADPNTALINDWSLISGGNNANYTITVNADQTLGTYQLAGNAADFDSTVSLTVGGNTYDDVLTVGGSYVIDGRKYTLALNNSNVLTLKVETAPKGSFFVTGDFAGVGRDYLGKEGDSDSVLHIYQTGAEWGKTAMEDGWTFYDSLDFNGDGKDDLLRSSDVSGLVVGEISQGKGTFNLQVLNALGKGWEILGTGDFNGNGVDDVLVANPTAASATVGLLGYWEGGTTWNLINGYSDEWEMVATDDFNGDGKTDMLWKNSFIGAGGKTYNAYCTWIVDDANSWRIVSAADPDEWNFLCAGDFDGNNTGDIAMVNGEGVVGIWGVKDGYLDSWSILSAVDTNAWNLAGVGDFNGDGTDDIAWCNTSTNLAGYWQINNKQLTGWQTIATLA